MSGSGEWLIYMAQRFSPYKFRAYQPMPWIGLKTRKRDQIRPLVSRMRSAPGEESCESAGFI